MRREKGFTLLELIIVVIVIGILASVALPRYIRTAEKGRVAEAKSILGSIRDAQIRYAAQWNNFTTVINNLDVSFQTKYFTYAAAPGPGLDPLLDSTVVGVATRNTSVEYSAGFGGAYTVNITNGGNYSISNNTYLL
ncbi:MAG TPA: prepilin-type N-terminal cleavage/methylation domain-containing protein [Candidatus Omnitrophota bacterium]|nr:prepilin-type N-terminal cleavage/methylation domain-containing protein [Candidatus Omnitrophota bacterium]